MFEPDLLEGKVALITGGGTGIGRAIGENLLRYGASLVISGRRSHVLGAAAREMGEAAGDPGKVLAVPCDVSDLHQVESMADAAERRFGRVDILVNNAAGNFISPTEQVTPNAFRVVNDIVFMGTVNCTLTLGKRWIASGSGGTVLNLSANYAQMGSGFMVPSACAKAGVELLTRSLASEWGKYGIRLVAIAPGAFPTKGAWQRIAPDESLMDESTVPLKRVGRLSELADLAVYLVSPSAGYITGEVVRIDGGVTIHGAGFSFLEKVTPERWREFRRKIREAKD